MKRREVELSEVAEQVRRPARGAIGSMLAQRGRRDVNCEYFHCFVGEALHEFFRGPPIGLGDGLSKGRALLHDARDECALARLD